jgi:hypothetical protein
VQPFGQYRKISNLGLGILTSLSLSQHSKSLVRYFPQGRRKRAPPPPIISICIRKTHKSNRKVQKQFRFILEPPPQYWFTSDSLVPVLPSLTVRKLLIYTVRESTDITLAIPFVIDIRLYSQSEILSRRVYSVCKNIHYVQDFRNFISRF